MINSITFGEVSGLRQSPATPGQVGPSGAGFAQELQQALTRPPDLHFSAHALQRLEDRGIDLTASARERLSQGLDAAAAKGARETLLVMDGVGFVASVPNRTIITVMEPGGGEPSVFTNIDSAVMVPGEATASSQSKSNGLDLF